MRVKTTGKATVTAFRLPDELLARVDRVVEKRRRETGFNITRSDVVRKLVQIGLPKMEKQ